jgi:hypothetical protein
MTAVFTFLLMLFYRSSRNYAPTHE